MRLTIIVVAVLATSACVAKHPVQIASPPTPVVTVDSEVYIDLRRVLARTDSLVKELKAKQRTDSAVAIFNDSLVYTDVRRLLARSVFTDSALHVARCAATQSSENWRKVCVPKDQSVRIP